MTHHAIIMGFGKCAFADLTREEQMKRISDGLIKVGFPLAPRHNDFRLDYPDRGVLGSEEFILR